MTIFKSTSFQPALNTSLNQALYTHLRMSILSGELQGGMKLPSTRALAGELHISRNTVLNAYRQLLTEGYLESRGGSGTYVANILPELLLSPLDSDIPKANQSHRADARPLRLSEQAKAGMGLSDPHSGRKSPHPFLAELPALDAFPYKLWSRLIIRRARRMPVSDFRYQDSAGYRPLREAIAAHLTVSRQVHCSADQIMILPGSQGAFDLASRMFINAGDPVWIEDPGYSSVRGAFLSAGAQIIPVPVDNEGMMVSLGVERAPQARMVYVTPSHQFPLGVTMSLSRRLALLDWAKRSSAYIIEDDYDSEFRFAGRPLATLQGLDLAGRVIYTGTFSKVLFPSLRIGYMVLPSPLVDPFLRVRRLIDIHNPIFEQAVLADFMNEGHFTRHLRRMRTLYAERRNTLLETAKELPLEIQSPETGIHCIGWLPEGIDDRLLAEKGAEYDLDLTPVSIFSIEPLARKGLLLGYGGFRAPEIKEGARRLDRLLSSARKEQVVL